MKVAITFFSKKNNKIISKFEKKIHKRENNIKPHFHIYSCIFMIILVVYVVLNYTNVISFGTNIIEFNTGISKEKIIGINYLANKNNYKLGIVENVDIIEEQVTEAELTMDKIAEEYKNVSVFGSMNNIDIKTIVENNTYQKLNISGIDITNYSTNRNIDFLKIINSEEKYFNKAQDSIAMYTTHTSESYSNSDGYKFEYTSPARTVDGRFNMLNIASTLAKNLNSKGINTVCSLTPHDYGEYNSAYWNSRLTLTELVNKNSDIAISIDVHRDAIEDLTFAPKVNIKGYDVACVMLVMGIGYDGEENPYYMQNLKLAFEIQMLANKVYPGLFRPMIIRNSVYNQDIKENSFLIEVGATGNTIEEAMLATRCVANLLNILYKD